MKKFGTRNAKFDGYTELLLHVDCKEFKFGDTDFEISTMFESPFNYLIRWHFMNGRFLKRN